MHDAAGIVSVLMTAGLVTLAAGAMWFDIRERRIPNLLTLSALAVALATRGVLGLPELGGGVAGAAIGFGVALPLFLLGGMGGGDLKLLAAVGAFLGPSRLIGALIVMGLVGGVMAVVVIVRRRAVRQTMANLQLLFLSFGRKSFTGWKKDSEAPLTLETPGVIALPYGPAIAVGALAGWFGWAEWLFR